MANEEINCCICGDSFSGFGNNPAPIRLSGRCCDPCNFRFVIRARLIEMQNNG